MWSLRQAGVAAALKCDILHYFVFKASINTFLKMNTYGKLGADELKRKGKKSRVYKIGIQSVYGHFFQSFFYTFGSASG
jgi:hypothetical protein